METWREKNNWEDWLEEKAGFDIWHNPDEALKRGYIDENEYNDIVQDEEYKWGEK